MYISCFLSHPSVAFCCRSLRSKHRTEIPLLRQSSKSTMRILRHVLIFMTIFWRSTYTRHLLTVWLGWFFVIFSWILGLATWVARLAMRLGWMIQSQPNHRSLVKRFDLHDSPDVWSSSSPRHFGFRRFYHGPETPLNKALKGWSVFYWPFDLACFFQKKNRITWRPHGVVSVGRCRAWCRC